MIAQDVLTAYARFTADAHWPGFDPQSVPLAIFDGTRTWLSGYPGCPAAFGTAGTGSVLVYPGRHPAILANSVAEIDGVLVATLLLPGHEERSPAEYAALALHEAFHAFQDRTFPEWAANEADLLTYPVDDPQLVALARIEDLALERALRSKDSSAWTATFVQARAARFAALPPPAVRYERQTELTEGLAQYLEWRALGTSPESLSWSEALLDVRRRCYRTGAVMAFLLDRVVMQWQRQLTSAVNTSLDELLTQAPSVQSAHPATIPPDEQAAIIAQAERAVAEVITTRTHLRASFRTQAGRRLDIMTAPDRPLWVRGFDPMNLVLLESGEVLHERYLALENTDGVLELFAGRALTEAAGPHPLFDGVRTVTLTGLIAAPDITETREGIKITVPGCNLTVMNGQLDHVPEGDIVRLGATHHEVW